MKYLNLTWIAYETYGWVIITKMNILMYFSDKLMAQKNKRILKSKIGGWFIESYGLCVEELCTYMIYGDDSGLQEISDSCFWNKK